MKYFFDCEFIEGFYQPKILGVPIGKKRHFIDLISIGIVAEDGREYYAISNEFNPNDANQWVKENVISKLESKRVYGFLGVVKDNFIYKSNKQIAEEIIEFTMPFAECANGESCCMIYCPLPEDLNNSEFHHKLIMKRTNPEFYGYYSDYDWVLFCSLFGRMIDLPEWFPMYCIDLKQTMDEIAIKRIVADQTFEDQLRTLKEFGPKQTNEHNALDDAKWNYEFYKYLKTL